MIEPMTDKQYEGMLKDNIACFDRIAKCTNDINTLKQILFERKLLELYKIPEYMQYSKYSGIFI